MKEYIEREGIVNLVKEIKENFSPIHHTVIDAFIYYADNKLPSADVAPVVHGKWVPVEEEAYWVNNMEESLVTGKPTKKIILRCSCCKKVFGTIAFDFKYCPNCGAKMDGGNK